MMLEQLSHVQQKQQRAKDRALWHSKQEYCENCRYVGVTVDQVSSAALYTPVSPILRQVIMSLCL